jgi:L-malate glycosyltransferase
MKVLFLAPVAATHDHHDYLNEIAKNKDIDLTLMVSPFWAYDHKGTSFFNSLFHRFKKVHSSRFYDKPKKYKMIERVPFFVGKTYHFYLSIFRTLSKMKPDIVHINLEADYLLVSFVCLWKRLFGRKTKIILFSHENIHHPIKNRFLYRLVVYGIIEKFNIASLDGATAVTNEVKCLFFKKGLRGKVAIVGDPVDSKLFVEKDVKELRKKLGVEGKKVIGYFSRFEEPKGILDLINAAAKVKEDFRLLLVGWSDSDFQDEVEGLISKLNLKGKVIMISERLGPKIVDYMCCSDFIVVPSLTTINWKEQFGRVNVEAMSCGVPVLGSSSGGIPEVVGEGGLIFKEGNVEYLKEKIEVLLRDEKLLKSLAKNARKRVMENYSTEKTAEITYNLYKSLLD